MDYEGSELELFSEAENWKHYFGSFIAPYIRGDVLEVGAGIGSNTELLFSDSIKSWSCLEPDGKLLEQAKKKGKENQKLLFIQGTSNDIDNFKEYDVILYLDVLEHIEKDFNEIARIQKILKKDGYIIILSPAHNYLYSPFDKAICHFRRYNKKSLKEAVGETLRCEKLFYLDSLGFFLSLANKTISKQSIPTRGQILFWDRLIVPLSKLFDYLLRYHFGKSILGIWKKTS